MKSFVDENLERVLLGMKSFLPRLLLPVTVANGKSCCQEIWSMECIVFPCFFYSAISGQARACADWPGFRQVTWCNRLICSTPASRCHAMLSGVAKAGRTEHAACAAVLMGVSTPCNTMWHWDAKGIFFKNYFICYSKLMGYSPREIFRFPVWLYFADKQMSFFFLTGLQLDASQESGQLSCQGQFR